MTGGGPWVRCWVLRERAEGVPAVGWGFLVLVLLWGRLAAHTAARCVVVGGGVVLVSFVV